MTDERNVFSRIATGVFNTAKNFTQTLGKKLGFETNGAETFFGEDSAFSRSFGGADTATTTSGFDITTAVQETVLDANPVIVIPEQLSPLESLDYDVNQAPPRAYEAVDFEVDSLDADLSTIDLANMDPFDIDNITTTTGVPTVPSTYSIQAGDSLSQIAAKNNMSVNELAGLNGITNTNQIFTGQELIINTPQPSGFVFDPTDVTVDIQPPEVFKASLLQRAGASFGESYSKFKKKGVETLVDLPTDYLDLRTRQEVTKKVTEDAYGSPEERFQEQRRQARLVAEDQARAARSARSSAQMMQFGTQTGGAAQLTSPTAYTQQTAPSGNFGYNAYQANTYGNYMSKFN
tara:strand:- start:907 stop:1950 length:1044 start_codon:yes stop_codon:yes gene_type:complete